MAGLHEKALEIMGGVFTLARQRDEARAENTRLRTLIREAFEEGYDEGSRANKSVGRAWKQSDAKAASEED